MSYHDKGPIKPMVKKADRCIKCGVADDYVALTGRVLCTFCQIQEYQRIKNEEGEEAVTKEAIRMNSLGD